MESFERYVGKVLDRRYHIIRVIGVGGMAVVYEARDIVMNRTVAVKMLKDEIAGDDANYKMNPPLRSAADVEALVDGLAVCQAVHQRIESGFDAFSPEHRKDFRCFGQGKP